MHQEYQYVKSSWLVYDYDMKAPVITKMKPPFFVWKKSHQMKKQEALCLLLMLVCFYLRFCSMASVSSKGRDKKLKADQK